MILITGASGQLGSELVSLCQKKNIAYYALSHRELDICRQDAVKKFLDRHPAECIINCAAYTAVDDAEENTVQAYLANTRGPQILAKCNIPLIHISTDYVFDGYASKPYETEDIARPVSVYGLSKRAGEILLLQGSCPGLIVRTSWLYSKHSRSRNFYQTILQKAHRDSELQVVDDQTGAPTLASDLAAALLTLYERKTHLEHMKILHFSNTGQCSRYAFAQAILEKHHLSCHIRPVATADFPIKARRPAYSVLSLKSLEPYAIQPRHWLQALLEE